MTIAFYTNYQAFLFTDLAILCSKSI